MENFNTINYLICLGVFIIIAETLGLLEMI